MKKLMISSLTLLFVGCSNTPLELPSNVTTMVGDGSGQATYVNKVDNSFDLSQSIDFEKIKLCAVDNMHNNNITLHDESGSFIGSYSGKYYQKNNNQNIQGGDLIKYMDEKSKVLVVSANTLTKAQQGGLVVDIVQYDAKITLKPNRVELIFQNINRAQKTTGVVSNQGFNKVGTWSGARVHGVLEALDKVSANFTSCVNS